jgi:hypothetical protein
MKRIVLVLASLVLLPPAVPQAPANNPGPVPPDDHLWDRITELPRGQPIIVISTYGPPLRCRFDGATDAFLFCYPPGAPPDTGYCFDRVSVLDVTVPQRRIISHPRVLVSAAIAGIVVGLGSTRTLKDPDAATVGLIGAIVVGAAGYGMSKGSHPGLAFGFAYHPRGFGFHARLLPRRFVPRRRFAE